MALADIRQENHRILDETAGRQQRVPYRPAFLPDEYRHKEVDVRGYRHVDGVYRQARRDGVETDRLRHDPGIDVGMAAEPPAGLIYPFPHGDARHGGVDEDRGADLRRVGFREYYHIGGELETDGAGDEPTDRERELKEAYEPPHSPFGQIHALIATGAFTYDEVMNKIPWCVILMMINDQGRMRERSGEENVIQTEEEELEFLGLK
nr:MAG TPA: hypothetical protein [Caudoviricetes sp.]